MSQVSMLPLTPQMIEIARNPSDPWLMKMMQSLITYGGDQSNSFDHKSEKKKRKAPVKEDSEVDVMGNLVKHLASKVKL